MAMDVTSTLTTLNAAIFAGVGARRTGRLYAGDVRAFSQWYAQAYGEPATLAALTVDVLVRYRDHCAVRVSAGTFNRRRAALNRLCAWATAQGLLRGNPLDRVPCGKWR